MGSCIRFCTVINNPAARFQSIAIGIPNGSFDAYTVLDDSAIGRGCIATINSSAICVSPIVAVVRFAEISFGSYRQIAIGHFAEKDLAEKRSFDFADRTAWRNRRL